ncbi:hypothetical protein CPB84DRAFT_971229 [Gymnopilus junonius]|uniref:F-box domain-containing protein n=1 Tax=Gymnopilus junonius TaxID=109634 RepID=A0A9P5NQ67_GYMJU|nr:hypothetical protein CPB84DRAFT_971229 [Gymnopilus junonius]
MLESRPPPRVSVEIWREIFNHFVASNPGNELRYKEPGAEKAFILSHVCSTWRANAVGFPALWREIAVIIYEDHVHPRTRLLSLFLRHARSTPLDMTMIALSSQFSPKVSMRPVTLFLQELHRARRLEIDVGLLRCLQKLDSRAFDEIEKEMDGAPWLKSLSLIPLSSLERTTIPRTYTGYTEHLSLSIN